MKKYIYFMFLFFLSMTHNLSAYCVHNYTDTIISVRDSQSGHRRMGWHDVNPGGGSTCCAGDSTGCHPDKYIKNIHIEAKNAIESFKCNINVPPHGDIYIYTDVYGKLACNADGSLNNCCSGYCCNIRLPTCSRVDCDICNGQCDSCGTICAWMKKKKN